MPQPDPQRDKAENPPTSRAADPGDDQSTNGNPTVGNQDLAALQQERDELRDQLLRSRAEFANYQKRAKQQAESDRTYAIGNLARDLLEAIDNLERATEALRSSASEGI